MTTNPPTTSSPDFVAILTQAAKTLHPEPDDLQLKRPSAQAVTTALLQAEKAAKQQRLTFPLESFAGQWQLCFTAPRKPRLQNGEAIGKGFYLPQIAPAKISFHPAEASGERADISNQIQLGPFLLRFTGPARYLGQKNLLVFDFTHLYLQWFGKTLYHGEVRGGQAKAETFYTQPTIAKRPFFAFFLATQDLMAARGRSGGLALWVRE